MKEDPLFAEYRRTDVRESCRFYLQNFPLTTSLLREFTTLARDADAATHRKSATPPKGLRDRYRLLVRDYWRDHYQPVLRVDAAYVGAPTAPLLRRRS